MIRRKKIFNPWTLACIKNRKVDRESLWLAYQMVPAKNPWKTRLEFDSWLDAECVEHFGREPLRINFNPVYRIPLRCIYDPALDAPLLPWLKLALCFRAIQPDMPPEEIARLAKEAMLDPP